MEDESQFLLLKAACSQNKRGIRERGMEKDALGINLIFTRKLKNLHLLLLQSFTGCKFYFALPTL